MCLSLKRGYTEAKMTLRRFNDPRSGRAVVAASRLKLIFLHISRISIAPVTQRELKPVSNSHADFHADRVSPPGISMFHCLTLAVTSPATVLPEMTLKLCDGITEYVDAAGGMKTQFLTLLIPSYTSDIIRHTEEKISEQERSEISIS
jgi:hypothetical protein